MNNELQPETEVIAEETSGEELETPEVAEGSGEPEVEETTGEQEAASEPEVDRVQRRIDKITRRAYSAEEERDFWKKQALERENTQKQEPEIPVYQRENRAPKYEDFNDLEQFTDALTDWKIENRLARQEYQSRQQQSQSAFQSRVQEFISKTPDYADVMEDVVDLPIAPEISSVITNSELGPAIAYYLGKNPHEVERINQMSPQRRYVEMGKLEFKLDMPSKQTARVSSAPAPISKVTGKAPTMKKDLSDPTLTLAEWKVLRKAQLK